jgi:hypothetical protein
VRSLNPVVAEQKRQFLIERLTERNILKTQLGRSIHEADYEELKYELVLSAFHEIDVECDASRWF